jgi:ferredoxin-NADP reductase/GNAT superfamily N-acetyltransferase
MRIRAVEVKDVPRVVALTQEVLAEYGLTFGSGSETDAQLADLPGSYTRDGGAFFVAEDAGRVVAMAGIAPLGDGVFELRKMYVAADARRAGLGRRLLAVCLEHARARGASRVVLDTIDQMTGAIALYEAQGFVRDDACIRAPRCTRGYRLELPRRSRPGPRRAAERGSRPLSKADRLKDDGGMLRAPTFETRLLANREVTPHLRELEFERVDGRPSAHRPGQWVQTVLPPRDEDGRINRAYSFAEVADGSPRFKLLVALVAEGLGSQWLHRAPPGQLVPMRGPAGTFVRDASNPPTLFVASGIGFAPVRPMFQEALQRDAAEPMWLLLGVRSPEEIPFASELAAWSKRSNFRVEITLSKPPPDWKGRSGHVQQHLKELWAELLKTHPGAHAYVCGWRKMVWPVSDLLRVDLGVAPERLRVEVFD